MAPLERWIEGITAQDSVAQAARNSLSVRLAAVQRYLSAAAERADEDVEYVHRLRVSTRRAMAALDVYKRVVPKKKAKRLRKTLRKVRSVAGNARDLDVLRENLQTDRGKGAETLLADIQQRRRAAQAPIVAIYRRLEQDDLLCRRTEALLAKTAVKAGHSVAGSFGPWATKRFRKILRRFLKASPSDRNDLPRLHRFRIRGKELRYAMELLAPAFPDAFRAELYPIIEKLQTRLGEIHDHVVAQTRFENWIAETRSKTEAAYLRQLLKKERGKLDVRLDDFASWWTRELQSELRDSFQRMIDTAGA